MARKLVTPDDYIFEFSRRTGEAAYQRKHKQTPQQAIQALVKEGVSPSAAKKRVNKVVRHLQMWRMLWSSNDSWQWEKQLLPCSADRFLIYRG